MERYAAFCGVMDDRQEFLPMPGEEAVEQRPVSAKEIHQIVALLFDAIPPGHILHMLCGLQIDRLHHRRHNSDKAKLL